MKNIRLYTLVALLVMAGGVTMQAQADKFVPKWEEWDPQWNVLLSQESTNVQFTIIFASSNDSITYEGVRYKIIKAIEFDYSFDYGLLREEAGKLFFRKHGDWIAFEDEVLLYDWTLSEGDTVFVQRGSEDNGLVLNSIQDTIMNDVQRRKFTFSYLANPELKEKWIEGMGSELGFPFSGTMIQPESYLDFTANSELLCYHEEGDLIWQNPNYDTCLINFVGVHDNTEASGLKVYPNPTNGMVTIDGLKVAEVQVYNALGQLVKTVRDTNEVPVMDLLQGVYLLRIADAEGKVYTNKITIQ
jgi:hypothetical protein